MRSAKRSARSSGASMRVVRSSVSLIAARGKYRFGPSRTLSSTSAEVTGQTPSSASLVVAALGTHRVVAAVHVHDLAGGRGEEVAEQRDHGPGGGRGVGLVPPERGAVAPHRLQALESGDRLGGQGLQRPGGDQ